MATLGSLPASAINLHQAYDEQRKGVGSWKLVATNALNVGVGTAASVATVASLIDPSYQTAAMVGLGLSLGANVFTGAVNYAADMGSTHKHESDGSTAVAMRALGQQAKANWKPGLVQGAKYAALAAAAGAVSFPLIGAVATVGLNAVSDVAATAINLMTAGFANQSSIHAAMPNLAELATTGGSIGTTVGLVAGAAGGLFPGLKRALARPEPKRLATD